MKKIILSLLTLFAATVTWADTALFVHEKSGAVFQIAFSEKPVVTYKSGNVVISAPEEIVSYPIANLDKFTFGEANDVIDRITAPVDVAPQPTFIYSIDGKLMRTYKPNEDGTTSTSLEGLPAGTYVIKNGMTSYKVLKR